MTTAELDAVGAGFLRRQGARSAPQLTYQFPGFNLISVNEEIVHGLPGLRCLAPDDAVKIDVTAELGGYIADSATTVLLPPVSYLGGPRRREALQIREAQARQIIDDPPLFELDYPVRQLEIPVVMCDDQSGLAGALQLG